MITTIAGTGEEGFAGAAGPHSEAELDWPSGVQVDPEANLYIADSDDNRVRRLTPDS